MEGRARRASPPRRGWPITVCHFPPGTSKWNKIEHRLFSHITMNWRGRPLTSHEVVVNTIAATRTRTGLRVEAALDTGDYPLGVSVSTERMGALPIAPHAERGAWNYTIHPGQPGPPDGPRAPAIAPSAAPGRCAPGRPAADRHEPPTSWTQLTAALAPAQAARPSSATSSSAAARAARPAAATAGPCSPTPTRS